MNAGRCEVHFEAGFCCLGVVKRRSSAFWQIQGRRGYDKSQEDEKSEETLRSLLAPD